MTGHTTKRYADHLDRMIRKMLADLVVPIEVSTHENGIRRDRADCRDPDCPYRPVVAHKRKVKAEQMRRYRQRGR